MKFGPFEIGLKKKFQQPRVSNIEIGKTGTSIFGGVITDEEYRTELVGIAGIDTYDNMRRADAVVGAALLACNLPIRSANWFIEPVSEDEKDKEIADFISHSLFEGMSITWDDFLRQALLMLPFGFMVFEKVFKNSEFENKDMIGWKKFAPRLPKTILKWETKEKKDGVTQQLPGGGDVSIPIEKLLIFTNNKEGDNWEGISVLRQAYRPFFFKEHIEKVNAMGFERQGLGIPFAKQPQNTLLKDKARIKTILKNIRANEQSYLLIPEGWEIGFMDMKANTLKDPSATIQRYNREILIGVLAQFLDLGSGPYGSRALSADQSTTFHNNLTAIAKQIADVINKYAIKQLVDLNFTVQEYPKLKFSKIGFVDFKELSGALQRLAQTGIISPDEKLEDWTREVMGLPPVPEEKEEGEKPKSVPKKKGIKDEEDEEIKKQASEFASWRSLTFAEQKINFKDIQKKMNTAENELRQLLRGALAKSSDDLLRQMESILATPNSARRRERLKNMAVKYQGEYRTAILNSSKDVFEYGKTIAAHEMKETVPVTPMEDLTNMSKQADVLTETMANDMIKDGKLALIGGFQQGFTKTQTLEKAGKSVKKMVRAAQFIVPAIVINQALNRGRRASFNAFKPKIYALQRSEVLDEVTCNYCLSIDSRTFNMKDPFTKVDGIHSSCRGIWVEIMKEEPERPSITGIPKSLRDRFEGINTFKPPKQPIIRKDSPAADFIKE